MTSRWNKFKLLMWKNWTLQKRNKTRTIFEILSPLIFISLCVLVRSLVEPKLREELRYSKFSAYHYEQIGFECPFNVTISYSPRSDAIRSILRKSSRRLLREKIISVINDGVSNNTDSNEIDSSEIDTDEIRDTLNECFGHLFDDLDISNPTEIPGQLLDRLIVINEYNNSVDLEHHLSDPATKDFSLFGLQFDDDLFTDLNDLSKWPGHTSLTFRFPAELRSLIITFPFYNWRTNFLYPIVTPPGPRNRHEKYGGWPSYVKEGFIPWAHSILQQITMLKSNDEYPLPKVTIQRYPHPPYLRDDLLPLMEGFISFMVILSFYYTCMNTVRVITQEKEDQLKEVMKIMGLSNWLHWTAWFVKTFVYVMISVVLIIMLLKIEWYTTQDGFSAYSIFTNTPWHMLLFFFTVYIISSICFWFMLSTFFSTASTAATIGGLIWFLTYLPFDFLNTERVVIHIAARLGASIFCNTALGFGLQLIVRNEASTEGQQWANLFTPLTIDDPLALGHIILMLIFDAILYMLIALYVEQVWPGAFGVAKPWYFLFTKDFWRSSKYIPENEEIPQENGKHIEPEPKGLNVGINIINLTKVFNNRTAVDKLSLKIFENQITVLLGHNGAGKTTTMSMLTGMISPTSGTAIMNGYDLRKDIDSVRNSLGLCPQHNVLFADLTIAEHIYFFSRLKGMEGIAIDEQIDKYIKILGLEEKRNVNSSALSGGMKRRLSVCTALCGNSKIILLDEPTSGMDPSARRKMWDLLQLEKKGRTMILTTHFMDEADVLGERVAILSNGNLRCVGSPFYLKKNLGMGYRVIAARETFPPGTLPPSVEPVTKLLTKYVPEAKLYSDIGSEVSYVFPEESSHLFEPMLSELEDKQKDFGFTSFGISAATLEEVFMRVGTDSHVADNDHTSIGSSLDSKNESFESTDNLESSSLVNYSGGRLFVNQWKAMLYKKWLVWMRSKALVITHIFIPVILVAIGIIIVRMWENPAQLPSRELELTNGYESSISFLNAEGELDDKKIKYMRAYEKYFLDANIRTMELVNISNRDMNQFYLENANVSMATMRKKNFAGATVRDDEITAWFSNFPIHDVPVSFSLAHKAIMGVLAPNNTFTLVNYPLPFTLESRIELLLLGDGGGFQLPIQVGTAMVFVSAFFIIFYIKENTSRSKLLQMASGMSPGIFWNAAFLSDFLYMGVIGLFMCFTFAAFQQAGLSTISELGRLLFVTLIFGLAVLPFVYLVSFMFTTPASGYAKLSIFHFIIGVALYLTVEILYSPALELSETADIMHSIFLIFPNYALPAAVKTLFMSSLKLSTCLSFCDFTDDVCDQNTICQMGDTEGRELAKQCCISDDPYFEWSSDGILPHIVYMLAFGTVAYTVLLLKEYHVLNKLWKPKTPSPPVIVEEDSDVAAERERILALPVQEKVKYNLLCNNLTKYYGKFLAVNQLSFGIKDGECFGLLGINGAGKTTTFKMLTGDLPVSHGNAWVKGYSIIDEMKTVYQNIGYCPQFDALLEELTGRETLRMFSLIRGIPKWRQESFILKLSEKLGFAKHLDKQVYQYSGGNKRKLSTSIALLGDPQVVYLDEPTTGMDPSAKRLFWNVISQCQCVILTSHSMEECEALCTRIAIMVDGQPKCIGSSQHLKNKFSQGYTLIIKLKKSKSSDPPVTSMAYNDKSETLADLNLMYDFDSLNKFLISKFPSAEVKEMYQGLITYNLPDKSIKWSTIFGVMESVKNELNIEDYSIGQTTLEQIFLDFTKHQISCSSD